MGDSGIIFRSVNNSNWVKVASGTTKRLNSVYFPGATTGFAVGQSGTVLKYVNDTTWVPVGISTTEDLYSVCFVNSSVGFISGANGTIFRTSNGGMTWTQLDWGTTKNLYAIALATVDNVFAFGQGGIIVSTATSGVPWRFQVIKSPRYLSPANNAGNQMINAGLSWGKITGLLSYKYSIATDSNFVDLVYESEIDTNGVNASFLRFGNLYYWRVRARHVKDTSDWSQTYHFTVINSVLLKSPANNATNVAFKPLMGWYPQTGITGYELELDSLNSFVNPVIHQKPKAADSLYQVTMTFKPLKTFYWRMRVFAGSNITADTSGWSTVWSFTTSNTIGAVENHPVSAFVLYPNPTSSGKIFISFEANEVNPAFFTIYDLLGNKQIEKKLNVTVGQNFEESAWITWGRESSLAA